MDPFFLSLLFVIAFLYASVGHGGASGYLALMAIVGVSPDMMRHSALILNVFVSFTAFVFFYRAGHFRWKLLFPFIIGSIPMAYVGASLGIHPPIYKFLLALCLIIAIFRILFTIKDNARLIKPVPVWAGLMTGGIIGLVSGFIGMGGGIILTPILLLFGWAKVKEAAAVSTVFILLNSISGLVGLEQTFSAINEKIIYVIIVAFTGGLAGSYLGSFRIPSTGLKYILASVLLIATLKLALL